MPAMEDHRPELLYRHRILPNLSRPSDPRSTATIKAYPFIRVFAKEPLEDLKIPPAVQSTSQEYTFPF